MGRMVCTITKNKQENSAKKNPLACFNYYKFALCLLEPVEFYSMRKPLRWKISAMEST